MHGTISYRRPCIYMLSLSSRLFWPLRFHSYPPLALTMSTATQTSAGFTTLGSGCGGTSYVSPFHQPLRPLNIPSQYVSQTPKKKRAVWPSRSSPITSSTNTSNPSSARSESSSDRWKTNTDTSVPVTRNTPPSDRSTFKSLKRKLSNSSLGQSFSRPRGSQYTNPSSRYDGLSLTPEVRTDLDTLEARTYSLGITPSNISSGVLHTLGALSQDPESDDYSIVQEFMDPDLLRDQIEMWERVTSQPTYASRMSTSGGGTRRDSFDPRILADVDTDLEVVPKETGGDFVSGDDSDHDQRTEYMMSGGLPK